MEREKRFLQLAAAGFDDSRKAADEDIAELDRERDAITPLESSQREEDLTVLIEWQRRYAEWLSGQKDRLNEQVAALSAPGAVPEEQVGDFDEVSAAAGELARELAAKVKGYTAQRSRLAQILDRRRLLQAEFDDLQWKLNRQVEGDSDEGRGLRRQDRERRRLTEKIRVVQTELLSLPDVDEDMLKHYTVLTEHAQWQREWLALDAEEYKALRPVARLIPGGNEEDLVHAEQRLIRTYDTEMARLARMRDELDRKRERVSPAGTLREVERSRNLIDLYDRLQQRIDSRVRELKVRAGAWEAEVAQLQ